jgi:hypothetical protein
METGASCVEVAIDADGVGSCRTTSPTRRGYCWPMSVEWAALAAVGGQPMGRSEGWPREVPEMPGLVVVVPGDPAQEVPGALLETYNLDGDWFGDEWFPSLEEAKDVATDDWGVDAGDWNVVAATVDDDYAPIVVAAARAALDPG